MLYMNSAFKHVTFVENKSLCCFYINTRLGDLKEALQSVSKNQPCDVIKMRDEGEVGKKTPKKDMVNPSFL